MTSLSLGYFFVKIVVAGSPDQFSVLIVLKPVGHSSVRQGDGKAVHIKVFLVYHPVHAVEFPVDNGISPIAPHGLPFRVIILDPVDISHLVIGVFH